MKKENSLVIYKSDKLVKVGNLIQITDKILSKSQRQVTAIDWEWWNGLDRIWKILFYKTIKELKKNNYYNFFYDRDKDDGLKIEITNIELNSILKLEELRFNNTKIECLKPLKKLTDLTDLQFYDNKVENLKPLSTLKKLERLNFNHNKVKNLKPLRALRNIKFLSFEYNEVKNLKPINTLINLEILYFTINPPSIKRYFKFYSSFKIRYLIYFTISF